VTLLQGKSPRPSAEIRNLFKKIRKGIAREGLANFLYSISGRIDYPCNGFPRYGVDEFMRNISSGVAVGAIVLDAGAGPRPYKELFDHARYQSCDFLPVLEETGGNAALVHTFYCDLASIPKDEGTYDTIICNQVLEHVRSPEKVIVEFYRILKPGGTLFLTAPQCFGIHMEPYNYFNFTRYGLGALFTDAGFHVLSIEPLGGIFWLLGKVLQKSYETFLGRIGLPWRSLFLPFHLLIRLFFLLPSFVLFHLDKLDTEKGWTLNYGCCCEKPFS
jgi:SAM-dependent methyltransferase